MSLRPLAAETMPFGVQAHGGRAIVDNGRLMPLERRRSLHKRTLNRTHTNSYSVADGRTHASDGRSTSQPAAQIAEHGVGR